MNSAAITNIISNENISKVATDYVCDDIAHDCNKRELVQYLAEVLEGHVGEADIEWPDGEMPSSILGLAKKAVLAWPGLDAEIKRGRHLRAIERLENWEG